MRMMPSAAPPDPMTAHAEYSFSPSQTTLSNALMGSACHWSRVRCGWGAGAVVGGLLTVPNACTHSRLYIHSHPPFEASMALALWLSTVSWPTTGTLLIVTAIANAARNARRCALIFCPPTDRRY